MQIDWTAFNLKMEKNKATAVHISSVHSGQHGVSVFVINQ